MLRTIGGIAKNGKVSDPPSERELKRDLPQRSSPRASARKHHDQEPKSSRPRYERPSPPTFGPQDLIPSLENGWPSPTVFALHDMSSRPAGARSLVRERKPPRTWLKVPGQSKKPDYKRPLPPALGAKDLSRVPEKPTSGSERSSPLESMPNDHFPAPESSHKGSGWPSPLSSAPRDASLR